MIEMPTIKVLLILAVCFTFVSETLYDIFEAVHFLLRNISKR